MSQMRETQKNIDLTAANWVAKLVNGDLSAFEHEELNVWLDAAPENQQAFIEANNALAVMDDAIKSTDRTTESPSSEVVELKHLAKPPSKASLAKNRRWGYVALAASFLLAIASTRVMVGDLIVFLSADYHTAVGEVRAITLEDGSIVTLGPDSAIAVQFTDQTRNIALISGLADFQAVPVEHADKRVFTVTSPHGQVQALGTRFIVNSFDGHTNVAVLEHQVEVKPNSATSKQIAILAENQAARYNRRSISPVSTINPERALSWQKGKLIFDRVTLREVVSEFSRYQRGKIMIANEAAARKLVSGVFDMTDPQAGLELISRELGVQNISITPLMTVIY